MFDEYLMSCVNLYRAIDITTFLSIVNGQIGMNAKRPELESWLKDREAVRGQQMYFFEGRLYFKRRVSHKEGRRGC